MLPTGDGIAEPSGSGAMPGWTVIGGTAVGNDGVAWLSNANSYGLTAETGNYFVSLAGYRDNAPYFGVSQTVATTVGQTYALTFYLGVDNSSVYYTGPIGVSVTAGPVTQTIENVSPTGTGNQWVAETVDFTATAASSTISIQGVQGGDYIGLDNVSLVQTGNGATGTNLITNGDFAEPSINPVGVSVTAGPVTTTFNNVAPTALGNTWTPETLDFTATSTTSTISFQGDQGQNYIGLDNVVVSIPTAPSSPTGGVFSEDGKIDTFTVPTSGTYVITGTGATGGGLATGYTGGAGAEVQGTFTLAAGDELEILVGGVGSGQDGGAGSGGGGSFVFDVTTDTLLEAAGGGGGASAGSGGTGSAGGPGGAGQAGTSGTAGGNYVNGAGTSFGGAGGTAGSGGAAGAFVDSTAGSDSGGGGGGFDSAGGDGAFGDGGAGFLAGGAGGIGASLNTQHNGGFGGGGGANSDSIGAGGGGGFSGGGGGEENVGGGGGSFIAPVATDVTLTGGENADGNGSVTIALAAATPDVFTDTEAASSGPLAGSYLWSDPNNWSAGVPSDGATVTADGSGYDDIASLSLASLNVTSGELYVIANSLTVGTVMVSGALTTLFADSGNAPGPVTVTVGAIDTSGNSYGAIGAGSSFIDNSATDPGNSYQAVVGGLVELASLSDASNLQINNGGTIALSNPAASTGALFEDLTAGDVLELPGTSVSNVSFTTNGLTVTTGGPGGGTYAFTNVSYFGTPLSGFTATHDATTGLEAITFTSPDVFTDTEAASSGPLAGSYLWSDPNNWSAGVPSDGATVTADGSGYDDIASLSLASLNVTSGESYVIANSLTVGTVMVSGALTTLFADSGNAPGPVTVTVGAIDTSGNSYGAIGAGSSFIDNSATDPGNSYQAVVGGLVELASLSDASNLQINNGGTIALSNPAASTGALFEDLTAGDVLELPGTSVSNVSFTTNGLTVTTGGPGGGTYAFTNVSYFGTPLSGFTATHDATTGLEAITFTGGVPCYCRGTQIRTDRDEVAVEDLAIGDIVLTMSGTARPIKWIGRRSYKGRFVMGRKDILPICIKAGALDDNVPKRDLWISPNHAMYFENNGGVLVEAKDLVNGVSIVQVARVEEVEYVHIELDTHDVIIAEGALSETFIDDDSRGMFHNADEYCALHSAATMATMVRYCARRLQEGYEIEAVRRHIAPRAGLVSEEPSAGELRGYIDLIAPHVVEGWAQSVDHPEAPVCLDIFSGGRLIGQVLANRFRKDLEQANLGSGCHSFRFAVPDGVTFTPDSVAVKRSLDGKALPQSAQAKRVRKSIAA